MADTAYGTGKFLHFVVGADIAPYIPVWDKSTRDDGTFSRADFAFDKEKNIYTCPAGKTLTTTGHVSTDHKFRYLASIRDRKICPLKAKCCPNMPQRRIMHDVNEDARDVARALMGTPQYEKSRNERKKVEMKFAHLKFTTAWNDFACAARVEPVTNSPSQPSCRTSKRSPITSGPTSQCVDRVRCMSKGSVRSVPCISTATPVPEQRNAGVILVLKNTPAEAAPL
jgi:hypothetical protein